MTIENKSKCDECGANLDEGDYVHCDACMKALKDRTDELEDQVKELQEEVKDLDKQLEAELDRIY